MEDSFTTDNNASSLLFGEWLIGHGHLTHRKLCEALSDQNQNGGRLGEVLQRLKMLDNDLVTYSLAEYLQLEYEQLDNIAEINMAVARLIPEKIAKRFCLIALSEDDGQMVIAMADPLNVVAVDTIKRKLKRRLKVVVSSTRNIRDAIEAVYHGSHIAEQKLRELVELELTAEEETLYDENLLLTDISDEEEAATKAPVIRFVNLLLSQAVRRRASDVHIEPQEKSMIIRLRVDGILRETISPPHRLHSAVITRIKILSGMNIAERRLPQDGRLKIKAPGRDIDVRVSSLPTIYGEKIVMRILDKKSVSHDIDLLGFAPGFLKEFKRVLSQPYGIIIVTGPTGSGKSTTLYSALNYLKNVSKNITTVENPVEYRLRGVNQVQVKPEIDFDFATCLRTILRQDPDIILIGEIRDKETVEIAIQASLTGHLVLSTFHTNDSAGAVSRLLYMGIEAYLLVSSLNLVVAQRLVRKLCLNCREPIQLDPKMLTKLNIDPQQAEQATFYQAKGCRACEHTGYYGRLPIFEILTMDDAMRKAVMAGVGELKIREMAQQAGGGSLLESGLQVAMQGLTTIEEVLKVTFSGDSQLQE